MVTIPTPPAARDEMGRRVRAARLRAGLTQQAAADRGGFLRTSLSYVENGRRNMTVGALLVYADALGVDPCDLIRGLPRY